jgi:hypothetical protein
MIRVTVELLPHGIESQKRVLGTAIIANDGTASDGSGNSEFGNYNVRLLTGDPPIARHAGRLWRSGRVEGFRRSASPWSLIALALASCQVHNKRLQKETE